MSSRSILIAVLGLTLNGCAVYDYDDERYDSRYYGGSGYSVQRYETYPVYPVYPQGYRYDYPRHEGYSTRYYYNTRHDDRYDRYDRDGHHDRHRHDRYGEDRHAGHQHPRPQPYGSGPSKQDWNGQRAQGRDQVRRERFSRPVSDKLVPQQMTRGHERHQERRQAPRQDKQPQRDGIRRAQ